MSISRQFILEAIKEKLWHYKVIPLQDNIINISLGTQSIEDILNGEEGSYPAVISVKKEQEVKRTK